MPRPKPPSPLKARHLRLADAEWKKLQEMGGAEWLRRFLGGRPASYWQVFKRPTQ